MKRRSYLTTPNRGGLFSSFGRLFAAVVAVIVLLLFVLRLVSPDTFTSFARPLFKVGNVLTSKVDGVVGGSRTELAEDRERLMRELEASKLEKATLIARVADYERLLGTRTEGHGGILAGVLAHPPVSPYDVLIVDQGAGSGVRVGATALGPGGIPVGTVSSVDEKTSRVTFFSSTGQVTEGWAGTTRIPVKLTGTGAGGFDAEIPGTAGALVGDEVYVPGPGALPIGSIVEVVTDPSSPSVVLHIRPYVNPFSITWVTILP
jgi:cell shape-determining protein MreC